MSRLETYLSPRLTQFNSPIISYRRVVFDIIKEANGGTIYRKIAEYDVPMSRGNMITNSSSTWAINEVR